MTERRQLRDRVDQLRLEAGVSPSSESVEVRHARLLQLQMESLGTRRRDIISLQDYRGNRVSARDMRRVEESRLSNQPGTREFQISQEHQGELVAWNEAYRQLEGDGTLEEDLRDINRGQTHRIKLMGNRSVRNHDDGIVHAANRRRGSGVRDDHLRGADSYRGTNPNCGIDDGGGTDHSRETMGPRETDRARGNDSSRETNPYRGFDRPRGGGRGGRGGGHAGNRNRGSRTGRIPTGYPDQPIRGTSIPQESRTSEAPHVLDHNRSFQLEPYSSKNSLNADDQVAPAETVPAVAAPATNRPVPQNWDQMLASPETFMATVNRGPPTQLAADQSPIVTIAPDVTMTSNEVHQTVPNPSEKEIEQTEFINTAGETIDILVSTLVELAPSGLHRLAPAPLVAESESPFSYSSDLIGLELGPDPGSSAVERDEGRKKLEPESDVSEVVSNLLPFLPAIRQQLRPDSVAQLDEIVAQLTSRNQDPSVSATPHDTKQVVSNEQLSKIKTVQDLPKGKAEKAMFTEVSNETKRPVLVKQPSLKAVQNQPTNEVEERLSKVASSNTTNIYRPEAHRSPSRNGRRDMIIGTHLMPGQSHRQGIVQKNSEDSSLDRPTLPPPLVTNSSIQSSLVHLTAKFDELRLERTGENKTVPNLATPNPFGSTASSPGTPRRAGPNVSLSGTLGQGDSLSRATEESSTVRRKSSWYGDDSIATSTRTELKDSGVNTASKESYLNRHFFQHGAPAGGSMLNLTGFSRPENQSPLPMSQRPPVSPVFPVASSTALGQRGPATPGTHLPSLQNLGFFHTAPSKMNFSGFPQPDNQSPGPSSRAAPIAQPTLSRSTIPSVITNKEDVERASVFKTTHFPTGPSQLNRTGLFREENQYPGAKKPEK